QIRAFLGALAMQLPRYDEGFRRLCLGELRSARKSGLLGGKPTEEDARIVAGFARYAEPERALRAEWELLGRLGEQLEQAGYQRLGKLVRLRVGDGTCLLALAVRFFFRQEVAEDPSRFQGLMADGIDQMGQQLETAFAELNVLLRQQGQRVESLLESLQAVVVQTHEAVLDVQAELRRQGERNQELHQLVLSLL